MTYKPMYAEDDGYLPETIQVADTAKREIRRMFEKYIKEGYSPRAISHIMMLEVMACEVNIINYGV